MPSLNPAMSELIQRLETRLDGFPWPSVKIAARAYLAQRQQEEGAAPEPDEQSASFSYPGQLNQLDPSTRRGRLIAEWHRDPTA